jgi:hypothetical protein
LPFSKLPLRPVNWLWPGWLASGKLAILDGDPGVGKSFLTLDLCARLTTGREFPDGSPGSAPANAIVLNGEDGPKDTIGPRLQALGADLERIYFPDLETAKKLLSFPSELEELRGALNDLKPKLVVIDPIVAFLDRSILWSSDQSIRRVLYPLAALADQHDCATLLVRHLNKTRGFRSLYRGGGSIGFAGACRSVWLSARDLHQPERCVVTQVKTNLAAAQPSLAYTLVPHESGPPSLSWLGPSEVGADELLAAAMEVAPSERPGNRARELLSGFLQEGPRKSREVWAFAEEQGITEITLRRAKRLLKVRSARVWEDGQRQCYWLLGGQELPEKVAAEERDISLEQWMAPLEQEFPGANPADDM